MYAEDILAASLIILVKGCMGDTYNMGTRKERMVLDVVHDIASIYNLPVDAFMHVCDCANVQRRSYRSTKCSAHLMRAAVCSCWSMA